jgi:hypothetical protein
MNRDLLSVRLFHGRRHPSEALDDWGFDGPCLGPFFGVQLTYGSVAVFAEQQERISLARVDDLLFYDGGYFGDLSIQPIAYQPSTAPIDERALRVPERLERQVRRPIRIPRFLLRDYLRRVDVFGDSIRELLGDEPAEASRAALRRVFKER